MKKLTNPQKRPAAKRRGSRQSIKPSRTLPLPTTNGAPAVPKPTAQPGIPAAAVFTSTPKGGHCLLAYVAPDRPDIVEQVTGLLLPASTSLSQNESMGHMRLKASYPTPAKAKAAWATFLRATGYRTPSQTTSNK